MPFDSTNKFLTIPVRAVRSFKKHSYLVFYQEPIRNVPRLLGPLRPLELLGPPGPLGPPGLLGLLGLLRPQGQLG